jgi:hypothetical protein
LSAIELMKYLRGLPEVASLVCQGEVKREAQWIPEPWDEWRLNASPARIQTDAKPNASSKFSVHELEVVNRVVDRPA